MIGQTVSHYNILEKLGEGGMGVVYKAQDTKLNRTVALKFLPTHVSGNETDKARFLLEAQAAAALNHPNICTIYGIEEHDGNMFIAMELIDGQTLKEKRSTLNLNKAIDVGIQIAEGLAAAHEKGIVHRDIKPENIMVRKDGIVQIMDFGLAKLRASRASRLTKEGSTIGTAGFMSPEQIQGQDTDHRSDIFSLGVLLYELFTGELPFKGVHESALMYEIVNVDPAPMSSIKPDIDPELDRIVQECTHKEPDERYQGVKDISKDLKRFKRESSKSGMSRVYQAQPVQRSTRIARATSVKRSFFVKIFSNVLLWQIVAVTAVLVAVGLFLWGRTTPQNNSLPVTRFTIKLPDGVRIPIGNTGVNISPDGNFFSVVVQSNVGSKLALRPSNRDSFEPVLGSEVNGVQQIFHAFSSDGQWVAFSTNTTIKKSSVFGGTSVTLCDAGALLRGLWWGHDKQIYFGHISSSIYRVSENGGEMTPVTTLDSASGEISHRFPELLPDGKNILYTIKFNTITTFDEAAIAVVDINSGEKKILIRGGTCARYVPTGHLIYTKGSFIYAVPFDLGKIEVTGPPKQLFKGGWTNPFSGEASIGFTDGGTLVYVPKGVESYTVSKIKWLDFNGSVTPLVDSANSYFVGAISPDGEKIALHVQAANDDIWLYHIGRASMTRLTFGGGNSGFPSWTPDGKYVIYYSEHGGGQTALYRKQWDGSGQAEQLAISNRSQIAASVSPDGKTVAYIQDRNIWLLPLDGSGKASPFFESSADEFNPKFSPDGKYLAYESSESGKTEVVIVPFPSRQGKWQISIGGGANPIWAPSGKEIYYTQVTSVFGVAIRTEPVFDYSTPKKILDLPPDGAYLTGISRDGKRFALITLPYQELTATEITLVTNWFQELSNVFREK